MTFPEDIIFTGFPDPVVTLFIGYNEVFEIMKL